MSAYGYSRKRKAPICYVESTQLFLPYEWQHQRELGFLATPAFVQHYKSARKKVWDFHSSDAQGSPTCHNIVNTYSESILHRTVHSSTKLVHTWDSQSVPSLRGYDLKGVFNLGFSPTGSILTAVCDNRAILCFDPYNRRLVNHKLNAHDSCVNYTSFIDDRLFVTASDDKTLRIWDMRNMTCPVNVLTGHAQWIKNVEYYKGYLISSSFDGGLISWDISRNPGAPIAGKKLFQMDSLVRTTVAPRSGKLIVSTNKGYIMVVHDLDVETMVADLENFDPDLYVYLQMSHDTVRSQHAHRFTRLFDRSRMRNRVELITDFHQENDAEHIMSLQINPQETCILSRNVNSDESSEYTCVHDLRPNPRMKHGSKLRMTSHITAYIPHSDSEDEDEEDDGVGSPTRSRSPQPTSSSVTGRSRTFSFQPARTPAADGAPGLGNNGSVSVYNLGVENSLPATEHSSMPSHSIPLDPSPSQPHPFNASFQLREHTSRITVVSTVRAVQKCYGKIIQRIHRIVEENGGKSDHITLVLDAADTKTFIMVNSGDNPPPPGAIPLRPPHAGSETDPSLCGGYGKASFVEVEKNKPRLKFYSKENYDKGALMYIKEVSFSADGRVICSPKSCGVRLLSFDGECSDISQITSRHAQEFSEILTIRGHRSLTLCSKFSPSPGTLVSGCLSGEISFYQPLL